MLKKFKSEDELREALTLTKDNPALLTVHCTIETELTKKFPETDVTAFLHENPTGEKLWIVSRINKFML